MVLVLHVVIVVVVVHIRTFVYTYMYILHVHMSCVYTCTTHTRVVYTRTCYTGHVSPLSQEPNFRNNSVILNCTNLHDGNPAARHAHTMAVTMTVNTMGQGK